MADFIVLQMMLIPEVSVLEPNLHSKGIRKFISP
jgi:hypothetical protein